MMAIGGGWGVGVAGEANASSLTIIDGMMVRAWRCSLHIIIRMMGRAWKQCSHAIVGGTMVGGWM